MHYTVHRVISFSFSSFCSVRREPSAQNNVLKLMRRAKAHKLGGQLGVDGKTWRELKNWYEDAESRVGWDGSRNTSRDSSLYFEFICFQSSVCASDVVTDGALLIPSSTALAWSTLNYLLHYPLDVEQVVDYCVVYCR